MLWSCPHLSLLIFLLLDIDEILGLTKALIQAQLGEKEGRKVFKEMLSNSSQTTPSSLLKETGM